MRQRRTWRIKHNADTRRLGVCLCRRRSAAPLLAVFISPSLADLVTNPTFVATALAWTLAQTLKARSAPLFHR